MLNTAELLDQAKKRQGFPSDYRLAKVLQVTEQSVQHWRKGNPPSQDKARELARLAELDEGLVLAAMEAERAKTEEGRAAWEKVAERLARVVAGLAVVVIMSGGLMAESRAESTTYNGSPAAGRSIHCSGSLRQLGAAVLRWTCQMLQVLCTRWRPTLAAC